MRPFTALSLCLSLTLASCAGSASPEDAQMANALCTQGKALIASGKTGEARDVYASATVRDDENARAWNGLGVADDLLGKHSEAEDAYKHAIALAPEDLTGINNLAHLYVATGRADEAIMLLEPHAADPNASPTLRQNLDAARKAQQATQSVVEDNYADLGSYPTEGMAKAHINDAQSYLGEDAKDVSISVVPEVKIPGGTPVFTLKATGLPSQKICEALIAEAFPCISHGK